MDIDGYLKGGAWETDGENETMCLPQKNKDGNLEASLKGDRERQTDVIDLKEWKLVVPGGSVS